MNNVKILSLDDLADLHNQHAEELAYYIAKHYSPAHEAPDILQEVFYLAARSIAKGKVKAENPRTWLYKITRNFIISKYRQQGRKITSVAEVEVGADSFEEKLLDEMLLDSVFKFVRETCQPKEIEVFELRMLNNMDYKQIAEVIGSSKSSVARMLQNLIKKINLEFNG